VNTTIFLDVNRFARHSAFLHGVLGGLAGRAGLAVLAAVLVLGLAQARLARSRLRPGFIALAWPVVALALGLGIAELIGHVLDRARPPAVLRGIEVIGTPGTGFALPDLRATAAAAICVGLLVLGAPASAALALLVALVVAFTGIYTGAHFPLDEVVGLVLGAVVAFVGLPVARHRPAGATATHPHRTPSLTADLAGFGRASAMANAGPAATPPQLAATGSVRLLEAPSGAGASGALPKPLVASLQPLRRDAPAEAPPRPGERPEPGAAAPAAAVVKAGPLPAAAKVEPGQDRPPTIVFPRPRQADSRG
jgi:undecaprenyl-diphosphatase